VHCDKRHHAFLRAYNCEHMAVSAGHIKVAVMPRKGGCAAMHAAVLPVIMHSGEEQGFEMGECLGGGGGGGFKPAPPPPPPRLTATCMHTEEFMTYLLTMNCSVIGGTITDSLKRGFARPGRGPSNAVIGKRTGAVHPVSPSGWSKEEREATPYAFQPPKIYRLLPTHAAAALLLGSGGSPLVCSFLREFAAPAPVVSSQMSFNL